MTRNIWCGIAARVLACGLLALPVACERGHADAGASGEELRGPVPSSKRVEVVAASPQPPRAVVPSPARPTGSSIDGASLEVLRQALASADWATRMIAVEGLGTTGRPELAEWLGHALGDSEHDVRLAAVEGLGRLGGARSRQLLESVRDDKTEDLDIRALAASVLVRNH